MSVAEEIAPEKLVPLPLGHGGDRLATVLAGHGVRRLFTLCGGHISPILSGARSRGIRVVDVRDEATAVFAADATARLCGGVGVAAVTAGPGLTNVITAVKNAQHAQSPLVILGGAAATVLKGRGALQDIDQGRLMAPHVKRVLLARRVSELAPLLEEAIAVARGGVPGPVFLECPIDLLYPESVVRDWYERKGGEGRSWRARAESVYLRRHLDRMFGGREAIPLEGEPVPVHQPSEVHRAARMLARSERPLLVIGSQAVLEVPAVGTLAAAVTKLGLPVFLSGMARGLLGASHPLLLRHRRREALREADLVVLAGVPLDFRLEYGRAIRRSTHLVAINRSAGDLTRNRRPSVPVLADPGRFLRALAGEERPDRTKWLETLRARESEREREIAREAEQIAGPGVNPVGLLRAVDRALPEDATVVADGGDFVATASYLVRPRGPLSWLDPGPFGTLGVGAGFALAAALARPDAVPWILFGDGSFGYSLSEIDTLVRHRLGVIAIIGNDGRWSQIARDQLEILHDDVGTVLRRADYERAAEGLGARGLRIERLSEAPAVLSQAIACARRGETVVVNALLASSDFRKGSLSV